MPFGAAMRVVRETNFAGLSPAARGKVRDIYDAGDKLLIVATDRLSAFDVILPTPIPDKGRVLTQLSLFWFDLLRDVIPSHVLSATEFPARRNLRHRVATRLAGVGSLAGGDFHAGNEGGDRARRKHIVRTGCFVDWK